MNNMDRIHDKANKLFNEVRKKKIKVGNINTRKDYKDREKTDIRNFSDVAHNSCLFCEKVFISSNYLMKHVYRRHAENLIKLHKRCILLDSSNSNDLKSLFTFLEEEFLLLKNELSTVKQAIGHKIPRNEIKEKSDESNKEYVRHMNKNCAVTEIGAADIDSNEVELLKDKVLNIESNIQCLHNKFEEFNSIIKTEVLFKKDIHKYKVLNEEKFLREQESQLVELRKILLKELKSILSKELNENNLQWKSKFAELKHDILKLDHVIAGLKNQIDSPDYLTAVEKKLEQQIIYFLGTPRHKAVKRRNSRVRNKLSVSKSLSASKSSKMVETDDCDNQINSPKAKSIHLEHNMESNKSHFSPEELSFLIAERLSHFNISHTSKLSGTEYEEKLKLINSVKDNLSKKYHNFSEIYKNIDICANRRVSSKLRSKRTRKLRFSDPLTSSEDIPQRSNLTDFGNEAYLVLEDKNEQSASECPQISPCDIKSPVLEKHRFVFPRSEGFVVSDVGGGGECSGNFPEVYHNSIKGTFVHTSAKEHKTSSPIVDIHSSRKADCNNKKSNSFINLSTSPDSYKNTGHTSVEIQNITHEAPFFKSFKTYDTAELNDKTSELDDFDKNSLESLSSWEDEENSLTNDGLH